MKKLLGLLVFAGCLASGVRAQIPVEIFTGHERTTFDLMFFRYFKNREGQNSPFLFFSRERAVVDYRMTKTTYLPQFGFTEAVSWNPAALKGFAPVLVGQVLNRGVYAKAGGQYVFLRPAFTFFGWTVVETASEPDIDVFVLARWTPVLKGRLRLFAQAESLNVFATEKEASMAFTQRLRLGVMLDEWQFGAASDFTQSGRDATYSQTNNLGAFLRHEF